MLTRRDRVLLWIARWTLREMSDDAAWWLHRAMCHGYEKHPELRGEG